VLLSTFQLKRAKSERCNGARRGVGPSVAAIIPEAAITYGLFDLLKRSYVKATGKEEAGVVPSLAAGVLAAFIGQTVRVIQFIALPADCCDKLTALSFA
jgi:hypothetical protein